jgi:flagellar hook-basal body complex protein FliE
MIDNIQKVSSLSMTRGLGEVASSTETGSMIGGAIQGAGENAGLNFASVLGSMATGTVNSLKGAEAMSFQAIEGKANTREVVDAVLEAQQSLQTAIALRDKIVSAYLEITKMPI